HQQVQCVGPFPKTASRPGRLPPGCSCRRGPAPAPGSSEVPMDASLQSLLDLLDQFPDEFGPIREAVTKAVRVVDLAPDLAVVPSCKCLDFVIGKVSGPWSPEPPGTRPLEGLVQQLVRRGHLPPHLEAHANYIRLLGNVGAHHFGEEITAADVQQSLAQLLPIL